MKKLSLLSLAILSCSLLLASCAPKSAVSNNKSKQKGVLLRLTPSEGSAYSIHTSTNQDIITHVGSRDITVHMNIEQTLKLKVAKKYDQDSLLIHASFQHIAANTSAMGHQTSFDSDSSQGNNTKFSDLFNKIKNASFTIKMTPLGKVLAIKGLKQLKNAVANSSSVSNPVIKKMFKNVLNKQKLKNSFFNIGIYPEEPITKESQWSDKRTISGRIPMTIDLTYTVKNIQPDKVLLGVKGKFFSPKDSTTIRGMKIPVSVSGTQTGSYTISRATGFVSSGSLTQDIKVKMSVMGRSIKVKTKGKTTISTTKLKK